jgi:hypothetical protein
LRDVAHVLRGAHRGGHRRHHPGAPVGDGLDDVLERAAVEPVAVGQVGKALAAAGVGAVTLRAVVAEQPLADAHRRTVLGQLLGRLAGELGEDLRDLLLRALLLVLVLADAGPAERAGELAQPRVQRQVDGAEHHGDDEQPQPPARQRVVQLAQVHVPDVAGGVVVGHHLALAGHEQQPQTPQQADHRGGGDEDRPAPMHEIAHRCSPRASMPASSSANGSRAASSKAARRLELQLQTQMPRNSARPATITSTRRSFTSIVAPAVT